MAKLTQNQKAAGGAGIVAAIALAVPLIGGWEGKRNDPYLDIVGIPTVCYGETRVQMRRYSDAECKTMLESAVKGFMEPVAKCSPTIANRPYQLAAATSLAYNIGVSAYCRSSADKRFDAGNLAGGCAGLKLWDKARVGGRLVRVQGLANRRADEYRLCMVGL